jgi:hypothetical protein
MMRGPYGPLTPSLRSGAHARPESTQQRGRACLPDLAVMNASDQLASLHDSCLTGVEVSWASGIARIVIEVNTTAARAGSLPLADSQLLEGPGASEPDFAGPVVIECHGLRSLAIPREEPWGPSNYINAVILKANDRGVQVEMCSGDVIDIVSDDVTIVHAGSGG